MGTVELEEWQGGADTQQQAGKAFVGHVEGLRQFRRLLQTLFKGRRISIHPRRVHGVVLEGSVRGKGDQEVQENCTRGHRGRGVEIFGEEAGRVGQEAAVEEAQEVGQHMKHIVHEFESDY